MADSEPQKNATESASPAQSPNPDGAPGCGTGPAPAQTPGASFAPTRPAYIPQFSAATQMILKRMKGEPSSLSAALSQASRSPSVTASIPSATYEEVKRRLVMGMNTSTQMTVQMPVAPPTRPLPSTLPVSGKTATKSTSASVGTSAIRKVMAGLTGSSRSSLVKAAAAKVSVSETKIKKVKTSTAARGNKRKRVKTHDDDEDDDASSTSSLSELSEPEPPTENGAANSQPTMTKSGRQVQKPAAYNPAAMDAASRKRAHYGKRTAEQALCKKCTRMHSPATNQMVFCDGCNDGWHQLCHDPWIHDDVVRDQARGWLCAACQAKRDRHHHHHHHHHLAKRQKLEQNSSRPPQRESWASKTPQQKRAYLSTLAPQELVALLMACLELHPDLPIFPASSLASDAAAGGGGSPRSLFAGTTTEGLFPRADAHHHPPNGQGSAVRKGAAASGGRSSSAAGKGRSGAPAATVNGGGAGKSLKEDSQERTHEEDEEFDPLAPLWPRPGMGLYARLLPDVEDDARLVDDGDYEAFSVIVYDERGRKVEENGMKV
ncbi:hypothetical protein VTK56DRAFT_9798 [Thermocarpiscus australiensis]